MLKKGPGTQSKIAVVYFCFLLSAFCVLFMSSSAHADLVSEAKRHYHTGLAYERLGRFEEAYTELQLASNLYPESAPIAVAVGTVAGRMGRIDESQRALEHSLALDANSCASYYELAMIYEKKEMVDRALESWHRFLALSLDEQLKVEARKHITRLETHA